MSLTALQFIGGYKGYLLSEHWRKTRAEAIFRAGNRCLLCGGPPPLQVHHRSYDRLGEELPEDLVVLCGECHEAYELGRQVQGGAPGGQERSGVAEVRKGLGPGGSG